MVKMSMCILIYNFVLGGDKVKKVLSSLVIVITLILCLTGCTTTKSYTFNVETGDSIKVKLNTSDGYDISSDLPFAISKDGATLSQGTFITIAGYNQYINTVNNDANSKVLDSGSKNGVTYVFYSYNNSEYNYIIKVDGSNTGILLGNPNSQVEAETIFNLLTFSVE